MEGRKANEKDLEFRINVVDEAIDREIAELGKHIDREGNIVKQEQTTIRIRQLINWKLELEAEYEEKNKI